MHPHITRPGSERRILQPAPPPSPWLRRSAEHSSRGERTSVNCVNILLNLRKAP